jgi:hypothetical protein
MSVDGMCINLECPIGCGAELPRYDVAFDLRVKLSDHTGSLDNIRLSGATAERVIGCTVRRSVTLFTILYKYIKLKWGTAVTHWLRYCATNQKVTGSIPDGVM